MSFQTSWRALGAAWLALGLAWTGLAAERAVVINEIMYHPPHDLDDLQYVELHNAGREPVNLAKWSFTKGIRFTFAEGARLEPGAFLVVCRNRKVFAEQYGAEIPAVGDFEGRLSHGGEKIELSNAAGDVVDAVKYADEWPWPMGPDGGSASLERITPAAPGDTPANWAGSTLPTYEQPAGTPGRKNDSHSPNLPSVLALEKFTGPATGQKAVVTVTASDADGLREVRLRYALARSGGVTPEIETAMQRISGDERQGTYRAEIAPQTAGALVRFRIEAADKTGSIRWLPGTNEPRPTFSFTTIVNTNRTGVPQVLAINVVRPLREARITYRRTLAIRAEPARGNGALIYLPPGGGEPALFDHVLLRPRTGGFKVHFLKDQKYRGMTGINLINQGPPRWMWAEPLAFEVYRLAGVPAPLTDHLRVSQDGRTPSLMLMIEQPNKAFLARNQRDDTGELFKLIWQGWGIAGQHEKKTRPDLGHASITKLIEGLEQSKGAEQWAYIQTNFNVAEFASYYAVNFCIQNWDGFHNNYYTYFDSGGTGKWEIYPWDEDKTWGDYDGASSEFDWYTMPLTMGTRGDRPRLDGSGGMWWRPGGWFGTPLLSQVEFRRRMLDRLQQLCDTVFTEAKILPLIDALEKKLEPEIAAQARQNGANPTGAVKLFKAEIQTFRNQLKHRRAFLLKELPTARKAVAP